MSMRLQNKEGITFELEVVGYEFATIQEDYWDSNWLNVQVRIEHPLGAWSFMDPCLTTFDVERLAGWFEATARGEAIPEAEEGFVEPTLEFSYVPVPLAAIQVRFVHESGPPWFTEQDQGDELTLSFPVAENDLQSSARALREILVRYPAR
jgi:hypothetical protein